jgi:hypothetical protein
MQVALSAQDVIAVRMSRVAVLERLIVFARSVLASVLRTDLGAWLRIGRWLRIALLLKVHINNGALDGPREPRKVRAQSDAAEKAFDPQALLAAELRSFQQELKGLFAFERDDQAKRELAEAQAYLDRPFGEVVALICKGIGMTPDWDAWASEPWAQEEIRTQPPGSPYAGDPPKASPGPPPELQPPAAPGAMRRAGPPGRPAPPAEPLQNRKARRAREASPRSARRRAYAAT